MKIHNPANGTVITDVDIDTSASVRAKYHRARAAQPALGRPADQEAPRHDRRASATVSPRCTRPSPARSRRRSASRSASHATSSTVSRARLDFFLAESQRTLRGETVLADLDNKLEERITHEPLGVIANISAWNYPYFVGSNVFVPALIAGNAVLYKPSEYATLTGLSIAQMLHESGVPEDVFTPVVGDGATGAAVLRQPVDGVFFTGSYGTGRKIAATAGRRMIKVQLELGGKDPIYVCEDVDVKAAAAAVADGAFYNNGQSCCAVERIYVADAIHDAFVAAFVDEVRAFRIGDPMDEATYIGPLDAARPDCGAEAPGGRGPQARGPRADGRHADRAARQLVRGPRSWPMPITACR